MPDNDHRVAVITGASAGIGRATAIHFARQGWRVGLIARDEQGLDDARRDVVTEGGSASVAVADVSDAAALERAAAHIEGELGPIDVWVNNAGISFYATFSEMSDEEFRRVTDVTYLGAVNGTRAALKRMLPRNSGAIVNVCSALAYRSVPLQSAYSGAKFALRGFSEAVRSELIHDRSRVHLAMVHPPAVNTSFFSHAGSRMEDAPRPPPPVYQPEVIADAIHFAATHRRREVMVGGQTVQLVLLNRFLPGVADWVMGKIGVTTQQTRDPEIAAMRDPSTFDPPKRRAEVRGPWTAFEHSAQLWVTKNRGLLAIGLGLAAVGYFAATRARPAPQGVRGAANTARATAADAMERLRRAASRGMRDADLSGIGAGTGRVRAAGVDLASRAADLGSRLGFQVGGRIGSRLDDAATTGRRLLADAGDRVNNRIGRRSSRR